MNRPSIAAVCAAAVLPLAAGCADTGPTGHKELCSAYKHFRSEYSGWHPLSNKGVFTSLRDLGDVASRYEGDASIQAAGPRLKKMGESDSFNMLEVETTTSPIAAECGDTSY
jgi:hypothetical protein